MALAAPRALRELRPATRPLRHLLESRRRLLPEALRLIMIQAGGSVLPD